MAGTETLSWSLDYTGCSAPVAEGGWGYCGPESCRDVYVTCESLGAGPQTIDGESGMYSTKVGDESGCKPFLDRTTETDKTDWSPAGKCDSTCTQVTTGVCSAEFLANVLVGDGVKHAWCNDKWLLLHASGETKVFSANLDDIPNPPGGTSGGVVGVTGMSTLDSTIAGGTLRYPLDIHLLNTARGDNNVEYYDANDGKSQRSHLVSKTLNENYGLPSDAGIGVAVNGQSIFPIYNNNAGFTPSKCEVDSCQEHVGQGGGQPHFHGDPFGDENPTRCLYGPSNYSSSDVLSHPPVIGFAYDGILIYGRYLDESAPGYQAPLLDACGGHAHDDASDIDENGLSLGDYHYHTQVFDTTCESADGCIAEEGETYVVSTTGPFKCYRADIGHSKTLGSSALITASSSSSYRTSSEMDYHCCGMTDYYLLTGLSFNKPTESLDSSSFCDAPAAPGDGVYDDACATEGATLYSGWTCTPTCNSGYEPSGTTRCVGGSITEEATCVATPSPTTSPTQSPTTSAPTAAPTSAPSAAPTPSPEPLIVTGQLLLAGVDQTELATDATAIAAIEGAIATSMSLEVAAADVTVIAVCDGDGVNCVDVAQRRQLLQTTGSVATVQFEIIFALLARDVASAISTDLQDDLISAVQSGSLETNILAASATDTLSEMVVDEAGTVKILESGWDSNYFPAATADEIDMVLVLGLGLGVGIPIVVGIFYIFHRVNKPIDQSKPHHQEFNKADTQFEEEQKVELVTQLQVKAITVRGHTSEEL